MNKLFRLAVLAVVAVPAFAAAQINLYIPSVQDHFDIDGIGGGGPFDVQVLSGPSNTVLGTFTMYCDSIPQEFSVGQTFPVVIEPLNGPTLSLDPWVITQADNQASIFDVANSVTLTHKQVVTAIQGVIWSLDGQIAPGTITSGDAGSADFANFLLNAANTQGTYVSGYARYSADQNYVHGSGIFGQSQIGPLVTPEPSAFLAIGLPLAGFAVRRRRNSR
jgi:hypothetical protein